MILNIDPKVDYAFKHLFGRDVNRPLLIDLINQVLEPAPEQRIQDIELLNPFNPKESLDDKLSILDIKARDQSGRQFNVEMQMLLEPHFSNRIVYYLTRFHQQQLSEGEDYCTIKPTIAIVFQNQVQYPRVPDHHLCFRLLEDKYHFEYNADLELHVIELPKFRKTESELTDGLDQWLYFLLNAEKIDADSLPAAFSSPLIKRAVGELKMLSEKELELHRYEDRRKAQLDHNTRVRYYREQGLTEGRAEGRAEGLAEGKAEGLAEGRAEGKAEGRAEGRAEGKVEGRAEGIAEGLIEVIQLCEQILQRAVTPREQLRTRSLEELTELASDLKKQLNSRQ